MARALIQCQGRAQLQLQTLRRNQPLPPPLLSGSMLFQPPLIWKWSTTLELRLLLTSPPLWTFISIVSIANFVYCFFVAEVNVRALSSQLASP